MSMGAELHDFVNSFVAGYKLLPSKQERESQQADIAYKNAHTAEANARTKALDLSNQSTEAENAIFNGTDAGDTTSGGSTSGLSADSLMPALVHAESRGNARAVSPKGALGVAQLMPGTARDMGVTDPFDAKQNLAGGKKYLQQQLDKYGNVPHALIAYNWGPGNADKWLKEGADPAKLPAETRAYVKNVMANAKQGQLMDQGQKGGADAINWMRGQDAFALDSKGAVDAGPNDAHYAAYHLGAGAAPPPLMDRLGGMVDPGNTMTEGQRAQAMIGMIQEHYKGKPLQAAKASGQIIQYSRQLANQRIAVAAAAGEQGNFDAMAKNAEHAYNAIPGMGDKITITKTDGGYQVQVMDIAGKKVSADTTMSGEDLYKLVSQYQKDPDHFDQAVINAAGKRHSPGYSDAITDIQLDDTGNATTPDKYGSWTEGEQKLWDKLAAEKERKSAGPSIAERKEAEAEAGSAADEYLTKVNESGTPEQKKSLESGDAGVDIPGTIKEASTAIYAANAKSHLLKQDVPRLVHQMLMVDDSDPTKKSYIAKETGTGDMVRVEVAGGRAFKMRKEDLAAIEAQRQKLADAKLVEIGTKKQRDERDAATKAQLDSARARHAPQPGLAAKPAVPTDPLWGGATPIGPGAVDPNDPLSR